METFGLKVLFIIIFVDRGGQLPNFVRIKSMIP